MVAKMNFEQAGARRHVARRERGPRRFFAKDVLWVTTFRRVLLACAITGLSSAVATSAQSQELVVGQTLSLTGPTATIAQDLMRGRRACIDFVNSQGGVRGKLFKLVTRDDKGDPNRAVELAREIADREGAVVMLGSMGPAVNMSVLEWANAAGMAIVGPQGGDIEIRLRDPSVAFFLTANQSAEAARLSAHIASLGLTRVVIVRGSDRAGRAALIALEEALSVSNVSAVGIVDVKADGSDATAAATAVGKTGAQAVLLATSGRVTMAMLRALATASGGGTRLMQIYGLSSAASQTELSELGKEARGFSMSQVVPLPRDMRLPVVVTFQTAMRNLPGQRSYAELEGCLGPLLLAEVLRRKPGDLSRARVLQALRGAGHVDLGGFEVDLSDRTRAGSRFTDIVYIGSDGRISR